MVTKICRKSIPTFSCLILIASLIQLNSCAVRTEVQRPSIEITRSDLKYLNIVFRDFKAVPQFQHAAAGPIAECTAMAMSYLQSKGIFESVGKEGDGAGRQSCLLVEGMITDLRIVGGAARFWAGAMVGRSHMKLNVKLTDSQSGALVAEKELFGAPNAMGSTWSFGQTDRDLPKAMGVLLGDYIIVSIQKQK